MFRKFKIYDLISIFLTGILGSWPSLTKLADNDPAWDTIKTILNSLTGSKEYIPIFIAILLAFIQIYKIWAINIPKRKTLYFLKHLHLRYFPCDGRLEPNPDYRVTLLVPKWRFCGQFKWPLIHHKLVVYARAGLPKKVKATWSITESENLNFDGICGWVWARDNSARLDNLVDYDHPSTTDDEKKVYQSLTFVTERKISLIKWKARSFRASLIRGKGDQKIAVLMMESKNPTGLSNIDEDALIHEAESFQSLFSS